MGTGAFVRMGSVVAAVSGTLACHGGDKPGPAERTASPTPETSASAGDDTLPSPGRCKAQADKPSTLATISGDVYGFDGDSTALYYSSWEIYGQRGDVGVVRKDGEGTSKLTSLELEPRGLALDGGNVFYTSGIRLMSIPKAGGEPKTIELQFSSQHIATHGDDVFGVPGDYGPYDRIARIPKKGGETKELSTAKRPTVKEPPNGFSRILVDDSGVLVTDTGNGRVLRFPLDGGKPKIVAARQDKAYDLAVVGTDVYFTLARKGDLLVSSGGGAPKKVASGLAENARLAGDDHGLYTTLAGKKDGDPWAVTRIAPGSFEQKSVAEVPPSASVSQIGLDADCVYWVVRETSSKSVVYALRR